LFQQLETVHDRALVASRENGWRVRNENVGIELSSREQRSHRTKAQVHRRAGFDSKEARVCLLAGRELIEGWLQRVVELDEPADVARRPVAEEGRECGVDQPGSVDRSVVYEREKSVLPRPLRSHGNGLLVSELLLERFEQPTVVRGQQPPSAFGGEQLPDFAVDEPDIDAEAVENRWPVKPSASPDKAAHDRQQVLREGRVVDELRANKCSDKPKRLWRSFAAGEKGLRQRR
jgi:hypothetical protein